MNIHLGYELKTGYAVAVPLRHTAVIGLTQESGKTTTLEALISRSKLRALAFVTKRGEGSFSRGRIIQPYFAEPAQDSSQPLWQYVASLLETTLSGEKLKMQRSSIMRVCDVSCQKNMTWDKPTTLQEVAENIETSLPHVRSGFEQSMLLQLREYFRMVTPQIEALPKSTALDLKPGLNIMALEKQPAQMQALIIASCLNWIRTRERQTITIIPEGWKFLGEGRASPAMAAGEQLIREGGVLENFLWLDSQDLVGIATPIRKQIGVWILGRQGEINEAERTVKHLPTQYQKPKAADVQRLRRGEFYVSWGEALRKVYVQPAWMDTGTAMLVARTESPAPAKPKGDKEDDEMWKEEAERLGQEIQSHQQLAIDLKAALESSDRTIRELRTELNDIKRLHGSPVKANPEPKPLKYETADTTCAQAFDPDLIAYADDWFAKVWPLIREKAMADPMVIQILVAVPEIQVETVRKRVQLDGDTLRGRLARLIVDGSFDNSVTAALIAGVLKQCGNGTANSNLARELKALTTMGFLRMEGNTKATTYRRVPWLKVTSRTIETE